MRRLTNLFERRESSTLSSSEAPRAEPIQPAPRFNQHERLLAILLVAPFFFTSVWLLATGREYNAFLGADERDYHYPLIQQFARQWPRFNFNYGFSATTPLFHILAATAVKFFGAQLPGLRICVTMISALTVLYVYRFLRKERGLSEFSSGLATAVLLVSCYFFGYSFRVVTENLAFAFCLLAMGSLHRFLANPAAGLNAYLTGCVWLGLAVLTRQSYIFLCVPYAVGLFLQEDLPGKVKAQAGFALGVAPLPLIPLFVLWKGFVPPFAQIQCTPGTLPFYFHAMAMPLAILGFYTFFFRASEICACLKGGWRNWTTGDIRTAGAVIALSGVGAFFLVGDAGLYSGILNAIAREFPDRWGINLPFYLLVVAGLAATYFRLIRRPWLRGTDPGETVSFFCFAAICLVSMSNHVATQKYYDAQVLACLLWELRPAQVENRRWRFAMWILIGLFCVYQIGRQSSIWYPAS